jgi:putative two-component system response regulator
LLRIRNLLETRFLHLSLQSHNETLEQRVRERTRDLEEARLEVLERLTQAAEYRDDATGQHTRRVGELSARMARKLLLGDEDVELIRRAAPLHDTGKIAIPDAILLKPGRLTPEEFEIMKTHASIGARMLSGGRTPMMLLAEEIALSHHERWDGTGYPNGLSGEDIPFAARIVAIVDFYDALANDRPYRSAWPESRIIAEIEGQSGKHFDPRVVEAFLSF